MHYNSGYNSSIHELLPIIESILQKRFQLLHYATRCKYSTVEEHFQNQLIYTLPHHKLLSLRCIGDFLFDTHGSNSEDPL